MHPRTIYVTLASVCLVLAMLLIALNPAEERHIDQFVLHYIAWHDAHVRACPHCHESADPEQVRDVFTRGEREGLRGLGLRRRNFLVCSVLVPETDGRARTFGCLGVIFGPNFQGQFPCRGPQAPDALVEMEQRLEPTQSIEIHFGADGTTTYDGMQRSWDALIEELRNRDDRELTAVHLLAHRNASTGAVQELIKRLQLIGFQQFNLRAEDGKQSSGLNNESN